MFVLCLQLARMTAEISGPCGYWDDLIDTQLQSPLCAGSVITQQNVHYGKKLLNSLVLTEVLAALY